MRSSEILVRLLKKGVALTLPFMIYFAFIAFIDPFGLFSFSGMISQPVKERYASRINPPLYLLSRYRNAPEANLLMGDSRMGLIQNSMVRKSTDRKFFNFSYGASSFPEISTIFWQVIQWKKLESVYIGLSLELYNKLNNRNRVAGAIDIMENPLRYFTNYSVLNCALLVAKEKITGATSHADVPAMSRSEFWNYQLNTTGKRYFTNWVYPENYYKELEKIRDFCSLHGIRIIFVVFPTHMELQRLIDINNLREAEQRFLGDLSDLAEVYNFNIVSELTRRKENFDDPFHVKSDVAAKLAEVIFRDDTVSGINSDRLFIHMMPVSKKNTR